MFTIGEFSRITSLSPKALRLYHERGLLVPSRVGAGSGYRHYDERDLEKALLVQRLRGLGLSLDEIQRVTADFADDSDLVDFLERKRGELEAELRRLRSAAKGVRDLIANERAAIGLRERAGRITEKEVPPALVASVRWKGPYADCGKVFGRVARAAGLRIAGKPFNLYYCEEYSDDGAETESGFPIRRPFSAEGITVRELPAERCLSLIHLGPYQQIGRAYARLMAKAKAKGWRLSAPSREVYLKGLKGPGMIFRGNPARYVTEVLFPIAG